MKGALRGAIILLGILIVFLAGIFIFQDRLLSYAIRKVQQKIRQDYKVELSLSKATLSNFQTITIEDLSICPDDNDTLLTVERLKAGVSFSELLHGRFSFSSFLASGIKLQLIRQDSSDNFSFLLKKRTNNSDSVNRMDLGKFINRQISNFFHHTPSEMVLNDIHFFWWDKEQQLSLEVPELSLLEEKLSFEVINRTDEQPKWLFEGHIDRKEGRLNIKWSAEAGPVVIPYIDKKWNAKLNFDTALFSLTENEYENKVLLLHGNARIRNLIVYQPGLSPREVIIDKAGSEYDLKIGNNYFLIDSSSSAYFNSVTVHPYLKYLRKPDKKLELGLSMPETSADSFFNSLPGGIFDKLEGLSASGSLSYRMHFALDFNNPDSLEFESELKKHGFGIRKFGTEFLPKINGSFSYTAYEKGVPVKTFIVGPENPDFTPLYSISPYLKGAVLTSEDGGFYLHRGFNQEAFRNSISADIKKGRFARGGSTISMQLVKNVFLNRNKNIGRKLQEALIVWLIENNGLSSKDRMFEVYLNIIEWGPMIYGIKEAADFYFRKKPADLTLAESIFLASIIPNPKGFKYSFESNGMLKSRLFGYFKLVSAHMLKKQYITEDEYNNLFPYIELKGPARQLIIPSGELPADLFQEQ